MILGLLIERMSAPLPELSHDFDQSLLNAAQAARMSVWRYDLKTRRLALMGDVVARLGLSGRMVMLDIADWRARVCVDDHPVMDAATRALASDDFSEAAYRVRAEDGEWIWLALRGGVMPSGSGQPDALTGFSLNSADWSASASLLMAWRPAWSGSGLMIS